MPEGKAAYRSLNDCNEDAATACDNPFYLNTVRGKNIYVAACIL